MRLIENGPRYQYGMVYAWLLGKNRDMPLPDTRPCQALLQSSKPAGVQTRH